MALIIPQELIDLFIDELAWGMTDNPQCQFRQALLACSLVSHSVGHRSRQQLFSRIFITKSFNVCCAQKLRDIMKQNHQICSYIVSLEIPLIRDEDYFNKPVYDERAVTLTSVIVEILDILTETANPRSGNKRLQLKLNSSYPVPVLQWDQLSKKFVASLTKLIHKRGSTLKALHIFGIRGLPTSIITNCLPSLQSLSIRSLTFEKSVCQAASGEEMDDLLLNRPSSVASNLPFPERRCRSNDPTVFRQLRDLEISPMSDQYKLVGRIIQLASPMLESLKLETQITRHGSRQHLEFANHINLSELCSLRFLKLTGHFAFRDGFSLPISFTLLLSIFAPATQTLMSVETLELVVGIENMKQNQEDVIPLAHSSWYKLGKELTSLRFPRLCRVGLVVQFTFFSTLLPNHSLKTEKQKCIENALNDSLVDLYSFPTISINTRVEVQSWNLK